MVFINAFISGLLYLVYMVSEGWFWIFGIAILIIISIIENKSVETMYVDDERRLI